MSGKKRIEGFLFLFVIILGGVIFWHLRDIPVEYMFTSVMPVFHENREVSILVVGDIMLDRDVRKNIQKKGFDSFMGGVKELVGEADIAVANLEGPFTTYPPIVLASTTAFNFQFTFDPSLAPELSVLGFDVLGLANNHTLNFGYKGLNMTREFIHGSGMKYYGEPDNTKEISLVVPRNGFKIGFVGFNEFGYRNFDYVLSEIDRLRPLVDFLVVTPHWGIEYQKEPTEDMKEWAREFIDHGADAVIGSHPHVVGEMEEYNGKKIFYSLGNFTFDQYWSKATSKGLAVLIKIDERDGLSYDLIPIKIDKGGVSLDII